MSVVNLFGTAPGVESPDMCDSGVMGSEGELESMQNEGISKCRPLIPTGNALGDSMELITDRAGLNKGLALLSSSEDTLVRPGESRSGAGRSTTTGADGKSDDH